ncbi:MAG: AAA family ATPase, partial [Lachnospiraceae bacterium]|nr:AAA family ATPase [Lachnospiraceae bacterium]
MGIYFDPDNVMFQRAVKSEIYVDKTELMAVTNKLLGTESAFLCVSRPRRFGKSMALNMLCAYYSRGCDSRELFSGYRIAGKMGFGEHLNKYHVIQLNMRDYLDRADTIEDMIEKIRKKLFAEADRELTGIEWFDSSDFLEIFNDIYSQTKTPFVFLIDEWDAVFRVKAWGSEEQRRYLDFLRNILKDKPYVALAYMTGILPIKKYGEHSALNMFTEYSMTNQRELAEFTGFTEDEVKDLCGQYEMSFDETKRWYDGYFIRGMEIYNPRSVVMSMTGHDYDSYWTKAETYEALKIYIEMDFDGLRDRVIRMIAGEKVPVNTEKFTNDMKTFASADDVLTLL